MSSNGVAAYDCRVSAYRCSLADEGLKVKFGATLRVLAARSVDVREHHGRATEYVILKLNALVHGDVVLDLYVVADLYIVPDVDVLTKRAVAADLSVLVHVAKVPDFCSLTDLDVVVYKARIVNEEVIILNSCVLILCLWR